MTSQGGGGLKSQQQLKRAIKEGNKRFANGNCIEDHDIRVYCGHANNPSPQHQKSTYALP